MIDIEEEFLSFSEENDLDSIKEYIKKYDISESTLNQAHLIKLFLMLVN